MQVHPDALSDPEIKILDNIDHWDHGQYRGSEEGQAYKILKLVESWPGAVVVIEDFILRKFVKDRDLLAPVRVTAMVHCLLWKLGISTFRQQPAEAKTTATDERLKLWKLYRSEGGEQHARDADRHAITFLRKCKEREKLRCESWKYIYGEYIQPAPTNGTNIATEMFASFDNGDAMRWSNMSKTFTDRRRTSA